MRIGLISQWFPPEQGSAALPGTITSALVGTGHTIDVVTAFPNYPEGELQPGWRQRWTFTEVRSQASVHRTPVYVSHDSNAVRRMINYVSFALSATVTGVRRLRNVDVVWVHATPALPALPAMFLRAIRGTPYVLHIQDLWPDTVLATGMLPARIEPVARAVLEGFCRLSYRYAGAIGVITPGMKTTLVARGVPASKILDIPNWADESIFKPQDPHRDARSELGIPEGFVAMYAGAMGDVQDLETIVRAAALVSDIPDLHISLVGGGVAKPRLKALAAELALTNITFHEPQPLQAMSRVLACADMQLICLADLPLYRITVPSKIPATLAAGSPVLICAGGDAAALVLEAGAGLACEPGDPHSLANAIRAAYAASPEERRAWAESGRSYYEQHMSEELGVSRMNAALTMAANSRKRRRTA